MSQSANRSRNTGMKLLRCFSSNEKAAKWIEKQIEERVRTFHIDRDAAVDGWFVKLEGEEHAIQYDVRELQVE